ncbi:hypothetical protein K1719_029724 [Acacia pycnantha]|nr:hypothetical protein K1719_029724 [Acacia pycnantha]
MSHIEVKGLDDINSHDVTLLGGVLFLTSGMKAVKFCYSITSTSFFFNILRSILQDCWMNDSKPGSYGRQIPFIFKLFFDPNRPLLL